MSPKNLIASSKTHKLLLNKLKDKRTRQIYNKFEKYLNINENFAVAVSGGPDSLALSFLAKIYSIKNLLKVKYFTFIKFLIANIFAKKDKARLSGPPETATIKS